MLDKKSILSRKPKIEEVHIKSLDNTVYVKEFIVAERNKIRDNNSGIDFQILTLILGVCDKEGEPLFTVDDIPDMEKMPQVVSDELLLAVINHNDSNDKETAKN